MEGRALAATIVNPVFATNNAINTTGLRFWQTVFLAAEGPAQIFRKNLFTYLRILTTLHYDQAVLNRYAQSPLVFGEQMMALNRKIMQRNIDTLGGLEGIRDPPQLAEGKVHLGFETFEKLYNCLGKIVTETEAKLRYSFPNCTSLVRQ